MGAWTEAAAATVVPQGTPTMTTGNTFKDLIPAPRPKMPTTYGWMLNTFGPDVSKWDSSTYDWGANANPDMYGGISNDTVIASPNAHFNADWSGSGGDN